MKSGEAPEDEKLGVKLNLPDRGIGIPCNDKRAHTRVVS